MIISGMESAGMGQAGVGKSALKPAKTNAVFLFALHWRNVRNPLEAFKKTFSGELSRRFRIHRHGWNWLLFFGGFFLF